MAKWGHVTLLQPSREPSWLQLARHDRPRADAPRASRAHRAIARRSGCRRAWPSAKRSRWRDPAPSTIDPSPEAVVARGIELNLDVPLDKLGPSIAMLPSADAAMVAFAEVTSFVRFYGERRRGAPRRAPEAASRRSATARSPDRRASQRSSGSDLAEWDGVARPHCLERRLRVAGALRSRGARRARRSRPSRPGDRSRLAELLLVAESRARGLQSSTRSSHALARVSEALGLVRAIRVFAGFEAALLEAVGRREDGAWLVARPRATSSLVRSLVGYSRSMGTCPGRRGRPRDSFRRPSPLTPSIPRPHASARRRVCGAPRRGFRSLCERPHRANRSLPSILTAACAAEPKRRAMR